MSLLLHEILMLERDHIGSLDEFPRYLDKAMSMYMAVQGCLAKDDFDGALNWLEKILSIEELETSPYCRAFRDLYVQVLTSQKIASEKNMVHAAVTELHKDIEPPIIHHLELEDDLTESNEHVAA